MTTTRYVHATKGTGAGAFDDPDKPARTIADAWRAADPGDTIVIQDAAVYREDELVIDRAVTIASSYILAHPNTNPADAGFSAGAKLPTITAKGSHRVLRITGTPATRATFGPVTIMGVRVTGGRSTHTAADPGLGCGGGIVVVDADRVHIERCIIRDNDTRVATVNPWPESDRVALRTEVAGFAGDLLSPTLVAAINAMISLANKLLSYAGSPPLSVVDRAAALIALATAFDAKLPSGRPNHWLGGQAFGGGVAFVYSNGELSRCLVRGNTAQGRGAGVAVSGYCWPTITRCWIDANSSGITGRRDGGGIGCTVSFPGKLTRNLSEIDLVRFLTGKMGRFRATVKDPLRFITISDLLDYARWLVNPAQPNPAVRGIKAVLLDLIGRRWSEALDHLLYFVLSSALSLNKWDAWRESEIEAARNSMITITRCQLTKNTANDDGGALYGSVLSRILVENCVVSQNLAHGGGGGVRLTMGSDGSFAGCDVIGNVALVDEHDPFKKLISGGGGIAGRNVNLKLANTRIGPGAPGPGVADPAANVTTDHAGGGLAFQADTEGALAGIADLWTAIQREVFGVKTVTVAIGRDCAINANGAGYNQSHGPMSGTSRAKGGGVWLVRATFPDAPEVKLRIEGVRSVVRGNTAQTRRYVSKVQPGTTIAAADEVCVQDLIGHQEWTEVNYSPLLDATGALVFER